MSDVASTSTQLSAAPARPAARPAAPLEPPSLTPIVGWHFLHLYYQVDRQRLQALPPAERTQGAERLAALLDPKADHAPARLQCFAVPGHKADFGIVAAGPDLRAIHNLETAIQSSSLGPALRPSYSFYSITEVSEYVPDADEYGRILREREGMDLDSPAYKAKLAAYTDRLGAMNEQRLHPEFPDYPCLCFYPMSKMRSGDQNWYLLPFEQRSELMAQHGKSGMKFAGRVLQVITASTGLDDWEWGVTLWARNPLYLKEIVYTMRFDESSAKYALFGPFYFGFILPARELVSALRLGHP